jgi:hypothetical protein
MPNKYSFKGEVREYHKLCELQGVYLPKFYGTTDFEVVGSWDTTTKYPHGSARGSRHVY